MVLPLLFAVRVADPAARYDAFMKARPAFVATVEVSAAGHVLGTGTLRVARPHLLRFDAKGAAFDYSAASTPEAYVDLDRAQKTYDERPSTGGFRMYGSRVNGFAQGLLPSFLLPGTAVAALGGVKPTAATVKEGDELHSTSQTPMGPVDFRLVVGPQGQPLRFSVSGAIPGGGKVWRVVSIASASSDPAPFRVVPPLGYTPFALPDLPIPLGIGEPAPLVGWRKGGQSLDLNEPDRGRPRLLAVLGTDSPPSAAARPFLIELGRSMPVLLLEKGGIEDPSGALMRKLSPPGTPMFYLVGADGTVKKLWFGFDPAKGKAWEDEVKAAAAEKPKS